MKKAATFGTRAFRNGFVEEAGPPAIRCFPCPNGVRARPHLGRLPTNEKPQEKVALPMRRDRVGIILSARRRFPSNDGELFPRCNGGKGSAPPEKNPSSGALRRKGFRLSVRGRPTDPRPGSTRCNLLRGDSWTQMNTQGGLDLGWLSPACLGRCCRTQRSTSVAPTRGRRSAAS